LQDKVLSTIGLASKAGKIKSGAFATELSIKKHQAELVIISTDASDNTKKQFRDMCSYRDIPCYEYGSSDELGKFTGNDSRMVAAVTDKGFAEKIKSVLPEVEI